VLAAMTAFLFSANLFAIKQPTLEGTPKSGFRILLFGDFSIDWESAGLCVLEFLKTHVSPFK
jgi:hypothetical protein